MSQSLSDSQPQNQVTLWVASLALIVIWGSAFTLVGYAVDYISPIWIVIYRLCIGGLFMIGWTYFRGEKFPKFGDSRWLWYGLLGIFGGSLPFYLIALGQVKIDSGLSAIIVGASPLITILMAHFFTDERLSFIKFIGFIIGFIGIIILFLPDDFSFNLIENWASQLIVLLAAISYSGGTIIAKRAPETSASVGSTIMMISGSLTALAFGFYTGIPESFPPINALIAVTVLGVVSTAIAFLLFIWVIDQTGPTYIAKVNYFVPTASVIFGVLLLGEIITWRIALALGIIVLGVIIARMGPEPKAKTA